MIVVCEGCERRFQLDDSRIPAKGARVRCKYCHHRFRVPPPGGAQDEARDPSAATPAEAAGVPEPSAASSSPSLGSSGSGFDTLFGTTGGAPIDGDRSLFGTSADVEGAEAPAAAPGPAGEEPGGISQDLRFVMEPPSEAVEPAGRHIPPAVEGDADSPDAADDVSADEALVVSSDAADDVSSDEALAVSSDEALAASSDVADDSSSDEALSVSSDEALSVSSDEALEASSEGLAAPEAGDDSGGEDSWEFADSSLSFGASDDEDTVAPGTTSPPAAALAEPAAEAGDALDGMQLDPGASHPEVASEVSAAQDAPSLRAVAPGAGPDSTMFEMAADEAGEALELAADGGGDAAEPEAPATAADAPAPADSAPETTAEIGSLEDWARLDEDDDLVACVPEPAAAPPEPVTSAPQAPPSPPAREPDPDWPTPPDDLPRALPTARRSNPWLEHAGWVLSLVLLLAVAQGTVRVEPVRSEPPPGRVEVAGLVAENVRGRFVENAASGTLFVVSGELRNHGATPHAGAALQVVVLDEHGFGFEGRDTPVGLTLSEAMVRETPLGALRQHQARLARTLGERTLAPGEGVSFQAIVGELPKGAVRFRVEPAPAKTGAGRTGGPSQAPGAGGPGIG